MHRRKADEPISLTVYGMLMDSSETQPLHAESPIISKPLWSRNTFSFEKYWNAHRSTDFSDEWTQASVMELDNVRRL